MQILRLTSGFMVKEGLLKLFSRSDFENAEERRVYRKTTNPQTEETD